MRQRLRLIGTAVFMGMLMPGYDCGGNDPANSVAVADENTRPKVAARGVEQLDKASEVPPELKHIADNAYLEKDGVLHVLRYERPWKESALQRVRDLAKRFERVKLAGGFDGASLAVLQRMENLVALSVGESPDFKPADITALATLQHVRELNLIGPKLTRSALQHVSRLSQLEELHLLHASELRDEDLAAIAGLQNLEGLWIFDSRLSDAALAHLTNLTRLRYLMFNDSRITYQGLLQLRSLKLLEEVSTSPAWLFANQVDAMRDLWPNLQGNWLTSVGSCFLWDVEGKTLKANVGIVPDYSSVPTFSPDGSQAVQSLRGRLYLLDANKGTVLRRLADAVSRRPCHHPVVFSGDGKRVAGREAAKPREGVESLKVWEADTAELLFERNTSDEHADAKWPPNVLALSAQGRFLAVGRFSPSIRVWKISDKTLKAEFPASDVRQLAFLSDGRRLLVGTVPDLHVWDLDDKAEILKIPRVASFILSEDEKTVVTHDGRAAVHVYDLADGKLLRSYQGDWPLRHQSILSPDGRFLVTTDDFGVLSIWNVASGKLDHQVKPADCHAIGDHLAAGQFTPDGKYLIVLSGMTPPPE